MSSISSRRVAALAALALVIPIGAGIAFADDLNTDDALVVSNGQQEIAMGSVCAGESMSATAYLQIRRSGGTNQAFANGATVTLAVASVTGDSTVTATTPPSISLPTNWVTGGSASAIVQASVTVTAGPTAVANRSADVNYRASGDKNGGGAMSLTDDLRVRWSVISCTPADITPPVVTAPGNQVLEASSPAGATATFTATATDNVDGTLAPMCNPASGSTFGLGVTTVTCSATDAAGNTGTNSFTITVEDTTAPVVSVPANQTLEPTSASGAIATYANATASDTVSGAVTATCLPASGSTFGLGTNVVTCTATDAAGNTGTNSFTITVQDTTVPTVIVPANQTLEATSADGATGNYTATASDIVDGALTPLCLPASGSTFSFGTTTVECSSTDAAGNTGTNSFTITVEDTTDPVVDVPADQTLEATSPAGATTTYANATATDIVDGTLTPVCRPASGSTFGLGVTTVNCSVTDAAGNTGTNSFTIAVEDTTDPVVDVPADQTLEATSPSGATGTYTATASDIVDGALTPLCLPASGSTFSLGTTTVGCSSTDAAGNTGTNSFTITVQDTTAPVVNVPVSQTLEATSAAGAITTYANATATDVVDGVVTASCLPASGNTFSLGTTTVNCSATDTALNTGTNSFTITVLDTTAPVISVPANITVDPTGISGAAVTYSTSASDIVDGSITPTCSPLSGSTFPFGTTTVNCTATDAAGNTGTKSFTVTVRPLTISGFYQPVDMGNGVVNTVKSGSTVPLKFEIFAGLTELSDVAAIKTFTTTAVSCLAFGTSTEDAIETVSTGGTVLRYDATGGQFIQNWQTPKNKAGTCYRVTMTTQDGSFITANFKLK